MVLLTMTPSIVEALQKLDEAETQAPAANEIEKPESAADEPPLAGAAVGNPVSHGQILDIWKKTKAGGYGEYTLEGFLRGATVYVAPPPPKPEPTKEYKALMARLRRAEEERSYERMTRSPPVHETFSQRFPTAPMAHLFAEANRPTSEADLGDDDISQKEVQKQVTLVVNFLISIAGSAAAIWVAAQWWHTTARLFLTLGGSLVVAIAEVSVYSAYTWRMEQGEKKEQAAKEVKRIVKTWVIGDDGKEKEGYEPVLVEPKDENAPGSNLRKRAVGPT